MQNTILLDEVFLKVTEIEKCLTTTKTFPKPVLLLSVMLKPGHPPPLILAFITLNFATLLT